MSTPSPTLTSPRSFAALPRRRLFTYLALGVAAKLLVTGAVISAWPHAGQAAASDAGFEAAYAKFNEAVNGDNGAIEPAIDAFTSLLKQHAGDPVLMAYLGSGTAMRAKATWLPWKKISHAEDGLAQLDKALALVGPAHDAPAYRGTPASLETRFVAAGTFLALPSMFNRQARGDKLLGEVLGSPLFAGAPLGFKAAVWLRAGGQAGKDRPEDARRFLTQAAQSGTASAAAAQAKLKELGL